MSEEAKCKSEFKKLICRALGVDEKCVDITKKCADVIVKLGGNDNEKNWLYFELKTHKKSKSSLQFGAVFKSQWETAKKNAGHYFFVLVSEQDSGYHYCIVSPQRLKKYVTGINYFTYINISSKKTKTIWQSSSQIETELKKIEKSKLFEDKLEPNDCQSTKGRDAVAKMNKLISNKEYNS